MFYWNSIFNWSKFCNDPIFAKADISIISLFLIKHQLLKFISYWKFNVNWFKFVNDSIFAKGDISVI